MTNILTLYREWRHSKGYGVHSPYAYMLVTDILALPKEYTYYDEPLLRPKALPRLALALQRYQWRFGREAVYLDSAQKIPHFIENLAVCLNPTTEYVAAFKEAMRTGVLFFGKRAMVYFPNPQVQFVAYEYRF